MMDPVTALGMAGNIVQFLDFSTKLIGKAHDIYKSPDGSLAENIDFEKTGQTMRILHSKLQIESNPTYDSEMEGLLDGICASCDATAKELLEILDTLKMQGKKTAWKSMRHAIKCIKGKEAVLEIQGRLAHLRDQLETTILVDLRNTNNVQFLANSEKFNRLDRSAQEIVLAVLENRRVLNTVIEAESSELKTMYDSEAKLSAFRHENLKATTIETSQQQILEHRATREEIAQEVEKLRAHYDLRASEIKCLIKAAQRANGSKERRKLKERANATQTALAAMDLKYQSLMKILVEDKTIIGRQSWKLEPYSRARSPGRHQPESSRAKDTLYERPRMPKRFPHMHYPPKQQWPPSEPSVSPDPETEKKLLAIEELMKNQQRDFEMARKDLAERDAKEAAAKAAAAAAEAKKQAKETSRWEKKMKERHDTLEKQIADEKAAWEKKVEEEKKAALAEGKEEAKMLAKLEKQALAEGRAMAEAEMRAKHFLLPWPSFWRGNKLPPILSSDPYPSGDD